MSQRVRLKHEKHLVWVRKTWCTGLNFLVWSPQTQLQIAQLPVKNISAFVPTNTARKRTIHQNM